MDPNPPDRCLLTGRHGRVRREFAPEQLVRLHETYLGGTLPPELATRYFVGKVREYECQSSGLRWYSPKVIGEADYYEFLARTFDWYYNPDRWDKNLVKSLFTQLGLRSVVDVGCGAGEMLEGARADGIDALGVEINNKAAATAVARGLDVRHPNDLPAIWPSAFDALLMLQVIEHVPDPLGFVREQMKRFRPRRLILSAPCHRSVLGLSTDPLSWPPHHISAWSPQAFRTLADELGCELETVHLEPLTAEALVYFARREPARRLPGLPGLIAKLAARPPTRFIAVAWLALLRRIPGHWATCSHSVLAILKTPAASI